MDFWDDSVKASILISLFFPEDLIQNFVPSSLQTISWEVDFVVTFDTALAALWSLSRSPWPFSCQPCGFFLAKDGMRPRTCTLDRTHWTRGRRWCLKWKWCSRWTRPSTSSTTLLLSRCLSPGRVDPDDPSPETGQNRNVCCCRMQMRVTGDRTKLNPILTST